MRLASDTHYTDICLTAHSTVIIHHTAEFPMLLLVMLRGLQASVSSLGLPAELAVSTLAKVACSPRTSKLVNGVGI